MKNPYRVGAFAVMISTVMTNSAAAFEPVTGEPQEPTKKLDPSRCYWLDGKMTSEGLCGEKLRPDLPQIIEEAENGNGLAAYRLGQLYSSGQWGVEHNPKKGAHWYLIAAEHGFHQAQARLGFMYEFGRDGVDRDLRQAVRWYEEATENGIYPDMEERILRLRERIAKE